MQRSCTIIAPGQCDDDHNLRLSVQTSLMYVLSKEADAILAIIKDFPDNAWRVVDSILHVRGKIIFSGLGFNLLINSINPFLSVWPENPSTV